MKRGLYMGNIKLHKAVFEVRYNQAILFRELKRLDSISKELRKYFPQPQLDDNALVLINPEKLMNCVVNSERTALDWDRPSEFSNFKNIATASIETMNRYLEVDEFNRLGLRLFFHQDFDDIEQARERIKTKLLSPEINRLNPNISRPNITFATENEHTFFQVNVAAATTQLADGFSIQNGTSIQYDIDVYTNEVVTYDKIPSFLVNGHRDAELIAVDLNNLVLG